MGLVNKLSLLMAKMGCAGLRNASEENKDDLRYVKAVVKAQGPRSFQFASDYIRSDAQSLIEMVGFNPEILSFAKGEIYDRYCVDMAIIEDELVDEVVFALKCLGVDENSFVYFKADLQLKIIELLNTNNTYEGKFAGKPCVIDLTNLKQNANFKEVVSVVENYKNYEVL